MSKAIYSVALLCLLSPPALAQAVTTGQVRISTVEIITVFNNLPRTFQCDQVYGGSGPNGELQLRFCYVPRSGDPKLTPTNWHPSGDNPNFGFQVTGPALVDAMYSQPIFRNTPFAEHEHLGVLTSAGYANSIMVNSLNQPCPTGSEDPTAQDSPITDSATVTAYCVVFVPAGQTYTFIAGEASRDGIAAFDGPNEGFMKATIYR